MTLRATSARPYGAGSAQGSGAKPSLAYMVLKNIDQIPKNLKVEGKGALLRAGGAHPVARLRRELYALYGAGQGGVLRRSTPPTLTLLLLLRASVRAFTLKVSHALISVRVLVLNDPAAGSRKHPSGGWARPLNVLASKLCTR